MTRTLRLLPLAVWAASRVASALLSAVAHVPTDARPRWHGDAWCLGDGEAPTLYVLRGQWETAAFAHRVERLGCIVVVQQDWNAAGPHDAVWFLRASAELAEDDRAAVLARVGDGR